MAPTQSCTAQVTHAQHTANFYGSSDEGSVAYAFEFIKTKFQTECE